MSDLTFRDALAILRFIDAAPPGETEVEFDGFRLRVVRRREAAPLDRPVPRPERGGPIPDPDSLGHVGDPGPRTPGPGLASPSGAGIAPEIPTTRAGSRPVPSDTVVDVKPPMAGVFYAAPSPGAPPFVEVGRRVRTGEQIGIVEVMKLFTSVLAPCDGVVRTIDVANESMVQADQTLMTIEKAGSRTA
ncbi:MAG: hypothetical protein HS109_13440 [Burkholderiales bacterium]|nr:hypothetical protein [Burkholderiales bacterium]MCE7875757.1 hypothetical protein [Betaproteobacteria bacterium PRO3]